MILAACAPPPAEPARRPVGPAAETRNSSDGPPESRAPWPEGVPRPEGSPEATEAVPSYRSGAAEPALEEGRWAAAGRGDPLDLARLAHQQGAAGLIDAAAQGGRAGRVALAALPFAEDAVVALAWLCSVAPRAAPSDSVLLLAAIAAIAAEPPRDAEQLARGDMAACRKVVAGLAAAESLPPHGRDLAAAAERMLGEHLEGTVRGK